MLACPESDPSPVALDNRFGDRQPQPGPTALFRTKEGLEDPGLDFSGDSVPVISNENTSFIVSAPNPNLQDALGS